MKYSRQTNPYEMKFEDLQTNGKGHELKLREFNNVDLLRRTTFYQI